MNWTFLHVESEKLAARADVAARAGDDVTARSYYARAADFEVEAFDFITHLKPRTLGIVAVSAAALLYKADRFEDAENFCLLALNRPELPSSYRFQLRQILQDVWIEQDKTRASVEFVPGQAQISIRGGQVVYGGAPLDLVVEKVKGIQSLFYRTIEHMRGDPLRTRGEPNRRIVESCRPWLFQAPPGSYQFSVAVQKPRQADFFRGDLDPSHVVSKFLGIIRAGTSDDVEQLEELVPEREYRSAFLKLARNLAPSGKLFDVMEIRAVGDQQGVVLSSETRVVLGKRIKEQDGVDHVGGQPSQVLRGVLRALHLDKDWIEISGQGEPTTVHEIRDALEDVIGPMVNKPVRVTVTKNGRRYKFIDIEVDD